MAANHAARIDTSGGVAMNEKRQPFQARETDARSVHHNNMVSALAGRDAARDEVFARLKQLPPEERAKVSPETFARLTPEQFATLLGRPLPKISPEMVLADFKPDQDADALPDRRTGRLLPFAGNAAIKIRSPLHCALRLAGAVGLCTGLASTASVCLAPYAARLTPPPIRQVSAATWPQCSRLTPSTDGCVYYVESALTWPGAAQMLGMPLPVLLHANNASSAMPLAKGSPIIVWRFRGSLQK